MKTSEHKQEPSMVSGLTQWIKDMKLDDGKKEKVLILFLSGVFLLLIATPVSKMSGTSEKKKEKNVVSDTTEELENEEKEAYIEGLENKLEQTIAGMEGAGNVKVMITLKDKGEKILDKNRPYESQREQTKEENKEMEVEKIADSQETVLVEKEGDTQPIVIQERYPDIQGVVVVCDGGDDNVLTLKIKEAVQALFSLDAHKIVVCKSK